MKYGGYIYILTNKNNTVLYVGVTSNLSQRIHQHRIGFFKESFTRRYNLTKLVYYEKFLSIEDAIRREKQLKAGSRKKKLELIEKINKDWDDLSKAILLIDLNKMLDCFVVPPRNDDCRGF